MRRGLGLREMRRQPRLGDVRVSDGAQALWASRGGAPGPGLTVPIPATEISIVLHSISVSNEATKEPPVLFWR